MPLVIETPLPVADLKSKLESRFPGHRFSFHQCVSTPGGTIGITVPLRDDQAIACINRVEIPRGAGIEQASAILRAQLGIRLSAS